MKVRVKKVHKAYEKLFKIGDELELKNGDVVSPVDNKKYSAKEMCKAFSNRCSLSDIFEKI